MQYIAAGLWWVVRTLFSSKGVALLLVGGAAAGGAHYTGVLPRILDALRLLLIDLLVWFIDQMLMLALAALSLLDGYVPAVGSTLGRIPTWVVDLGTASGLFLYVSMCLSAAVAIKLLRMIPGVRI
jgi:hypothetical protein